jgi:AraC family transcriptional regulator, ethanolamine operon transcriptional activator
LKTIEKTRFIDQSRLVSVIPSSMTWEQLQPGKLEVAFRVFQVGPLTLSTRDVNLAFHGFAQVASHRSGVMAVESKTEAHWRGSPFDTTTLALGNEVDIRTTGAITLFGIAVDQPELRMTCPDSLDASNLVEKLTRSKVTNTPAAAAAFRAAIRMVSAHEGGPPPGASGTLVPLLATLLDEIDQHAVDRSHCLNRRYAAVRSCERYMREHIDETVTLLNLSLACGMRSRSLINAFEAIMGYSPMDYLKRLRLSAVHGALLRADNRATKVIDVAMDWGFSHMGHFAHDYRAMFGEAPSQTLCERH